MEGLIPFVYRAIVQYRSGADVGSAVYYAGAGGGFISAESSPSRGGAYVRLASGDSGRFRGVQDVMPPVGAFGGPAGGHRGSSAPSPSHSGHLQVPLPRSASRSRRV